MSKPPHLTPVDDEPDEWQTLMFHGATAALKQVLALGVASVTISYELLEERRDGTAFGFKCFPPGEASGRYVMKRLTEADIEN